MELLFRSSGNGKLMTEPQSAEDKKAGKLSVTAITRCIEIYVELYEGRYKELNNKYIRKGNSCEPDSLTLLSLHEKKMYRQNEVRYKNEYITGMPDIVTDIVEDVKTCWDRHTYLGNKFAKLNNDYYWQAQCYLALTDKEKFKLRYCLVNSTPEIIEDEKRRVFYTLKPGQDIDKAYLHIERNCIFDMVTFRKQHPDYVLKTNVAEWKWDIPAKDRIHTIEINRNDADIQRLYARIEVCRQWIKENLLA